MSPEPLISLLLNVKWMIFVVWTNDFFKIISLFEFECIEIYNWLENTLAPVILSHKLNQFINYTLEVSVAFVPDEAISVEIHEKLHSLSFGEANFADESQEN